MSPKDDRSIFASLDFSKNTQKIDSLLASLDVNCVQRITELAVESIEGKAIKKSDYENLKQSSSLNGSDFDSVFSRVLRVLKVSVKSRSKVTPDVLKQQLTDNLQLPSQFCDFYLNAVFPSKNSLRNSLALTGPHFSICKSMKWRIDVLISNDYLSKIMEPVVIFEIIVFPNRRICFECKLAKFNQLRFAIASMLKVINNLEEKTVLKTF